MPRSWIARAFGIAIVLLHLSGCGERSVDEQYYLLATNIKIPYWQLAANGLRQAAADMKVRAELVGPDTYDREAQKQELTRLIAKKPAGIMLSAADPELLKDGINSAIAAGIPVVTIDSDAPASQRLVFIGTNNHQAGLMGGRLLAQRMQGKGTVVIFTIPAQANLAERLRGYQDALAESPRISIVQIVDVRGDPALAFDKTVEIIETGKLKVDAFVSLEATSGKEIAEVLDRKKISGKILIAMDTDDETLDWIDKGAVAATIAQRPYTMAYFALKVLRDLHRSDLKPLAGNWGQNLISPLPSMIDTGATLVDKSNLAEIRNLIKPSGTAAP